MTPKPSLTVACLTLLVAAALGASRPAARQAGEVLAEARRAVERGERRAGLELLLATAESWAAAGRPGDAADLLEAAVEIEPGWAQSHAMLGRFRMLEMSFPIALESLERAYALGQEDLRTLLYLGAARWETGGVAAAEEAYRLAVKRYPVTALPVHQLGRLLHFQGRYAEAAEVLGRAVSVDPGAVDLRLDLARALDGAGDLDAALEAYRWVVDRAPEATQAYYGLAQAQRRAGLDQAAARSMATYDELYRGDRERVRRTGLLQAEVDRGLDLVRQGRGAEALELLSPLPDSVDVLVARASAHSSLADHEAAVRALERAVASAPGRSFLRALLADARLAAAGGG